MFCYIIFGYPYMTLSPLYVTKHDSLTRQLSKSDVTWWTSWLKVTMIFSVMVMFHIHIAMRRPMFSDVVNYGDLELPYYTMVVMFRVIVQSTDSLLWGPHVGHQCCVIPDSKITDYSLYLVLKSLSLFTHYHSPIFIQRDSY